MRWRAWVLVASAATASSSALAQSAQKTVHVVVDADARGVTLLQVTESVRPDRVERRTTPVCVAPCESDVDPHGEYRIGGPGLTSSSTFPLQPWATHLRVHGGAHAARVAGLWTLVCGLTTAAAGGAIVAMDGVDFGPAICLEGSCGRSSALGAGIGLLVTGLVAFLVGTVLFTGNSTSVESLTL